MRINCSNCTDGIAEYIGLYPRPCEACNGEGTIRLSFLDWLRFHLWRLIEGRTSGC